MRISAAEQELLLPEIASVARVLPDGAPRVQYEALGVAVNSGEVGDDLLGPLGNILEVGLQSGRLRRSYGADGEQALTQLFRRTPAGKNLAEEAEAVSRALTALRGQVVEDVYLSALGPGSYGLSFDTDRCQISLRFGRSGVRVDTVAIGV